MRTTRVAVAALLALAVAACGRGDDGEEVTTVREIDVLQGVEAVGTFRLALTTDEVDHGERTVGEWEGVVDPVRRAFSLEGRTEVSTTLPDDAVDEADLVTSLAVGMRSDGDASWVRFGAEGESLWTDVDDAGWVDDPDDDDLLEDLVADPIGFLASVREGAGGFVPVGPESVDGTSTTHYRTEVPGDRGAVEVWLDDEDRPRRVRVEGATLELSDFGVEVDVAAPDEIAVVGEVDAADAFGFTSAFFPQVTGEWSVLAEGTVDGAEWVVHRADAAMSGTATTCWTFEVAGGRDEAVDDALDEMSGTFGLDDVFPNRDGRIATCPGGVGGSTASSQASSDPAVTVLGGWAGADAVPTAIVVSERFAGEPVLVVTDDGSETDLPLTAGVAVWSPAQAPGEVVELRLADGTVSCPVEGSPGGRPGELGDVGVCVRA